MSDAADPSSRFMDCIAVFGRDENGWKPKSTIRQFTPQLNSGNAGQVYVQHQAERAGKIGALVEIFGRVECFSMEIMRLQQPLDGLKDGRIVIHHVYGIGGQVLPTPG